MASECHWCLFSPQRTQETKLILFIVEALWLGSWRPVEKWNVELDKHLRSLRRIHMKCLWGGDFFFNPCLTTPPTLLLLQDVSCNEITALPQQIGQLKSLRELNVRRNYLKVLPPGKKVGQEEEHSGDVTLFVFLLWALVGLVCLCTMVAIIKNLNLTGR